MIGFLSGTLVARDADGCLIDVGGVGYRVACPSSTLASLPREGSKIRLWTHLHVREDLLALYAFSTEAEQRLFESLLGVAGVGPKVALQVCSAFSPEAFTRALVGDDVAAISAVPGIGKKTAHRIVLDLKDKLSLPDLQAGNGSADAIAGARSALENLGYSPGEVRVALSEVAPSPGDSVEQVIKSALKVLA